MRVSVRVCMFTLNVLLQNELPFFFLSYLLTKRICFILTTMTILLGAVKKDQSMCSAMLCVCMFEALVSKGSSSIMQSCWVQVRWG